MMKMFGSIFDIALHVQYHQEHLAFGKGLNELVGGAANGVDTVKEEQNDKARRCYNNHRHAVEIASNPREIFVSKANQLIVMCSVGKTRWSWEPWRPQPPTLS